MADASDTATSRERLIDAGVRLFAGRGFGRTSVGDIEEAAGFTRRGGTLYRHFESKTALLEAAIDEHAKTVADIGGLAKHLPLPDRRSEAELLAKWLLDELNRERTLVQIIEKDGDQLPELRDDLRRQIVDAGYRWTAAYAQSLLPEATDWDTEAIAVLLLGSLINYRRSSWTFGETPLGVTDERMVRTWTDVVVTFINATNDS